MFIMELSGLEIQLRCAYALYKQEFGIHNSQAAECRRCYEIAIDKNSLINVKSYHEMLISLTLK